MDPVLCSHASELAIRAALYLALQPPGKLSPVHEIAAGTGLPAPYLAKIMRRLICAGLVRAFRGPGGGVELGRPPEAIPLAAVVRAVEGEARMAGCVLGLGNCTEEMPCVLHAQWAPLRAEFQRMLEETSLALLVRSCREGTRRFTDSRVPIADPAPRAKAAPRDRQKSL